MMHPFIKKATRRWLVGVAVELFVQVPSDVIVNFVSDFADVTLNAVELILCRAATIRLQVPPHRLHL